MQGASQGGGVGEPRGAKSWAAQGRFLLMLKLLPPSAGVSGILSQLSCGSHLGPYGDFSFLEALEALSAWCWTGAEGRRHGWITVPCMAQETLGKWSSPPQFLFPHIVTNWARVSIWPLSRRSRAAGGDQRLCWKHIHRHSLLV